MSARVVRPGRRIVLEGLSVEWRAGWEGNAMEAGEVFGHPKPAQLRVAVGLTMLECSLAGRPIADSEEKRRPVKCDKLDAHCIAAMPCNLKSERLFQRMLDQGKGRLPSGHCGGWPGRQQ